MVLAFCLYKYFPFGGLQRDFLRIAMACQNRGHHVRVYTMSWQGEKPEHFEIVSVPRKGMTNHNQNSEYHKWVMADIEKRPVDVIVGFNKMPNLDIYYAADTCYAEKVAKSKGIFYKMTKRYKHYAHFESAVFNQKSKTKLLMLTDRQIADFIKHYNTPKDNFYILPPGISLDRKYNNHSDAVRKTFRDKNYIKEDSIVILQVGSDFKRKGVDRSLRAIAALPTDIKNKLTYFVIGQDNPASYIKLAKTLNIGHIAQFFTGRDDIPEFLFAADLLIHPARQEAAGIVLLEAIVSGLPVIVTDACGYAFHIAAANAGIVLNEPFSQDELNEALSTILLKKSKIQIFAKNAMLYSNNTDLYSLPERAADIILGEKNA